MLTPRMLTIFTVLMLMLIGAAACQPRTDAQPAPPAQQPLERFTGVLQSGIMAIGGETTGWRLVGDGETGGIEVDVSNIRQRAHRLDGQRVTVSGHMIDHEYVERGRVRILVAERIQPAP